MADDEDSSSRLLDENGRLFGLVNIVDALVVLLVLVVVVAGVALLLPSNSGEPETRYVTLNLGDQPDFLAEEISAGDEWSPERTSDSITITDVYRFNNADNGTDILARAEVNGTEIEPEEPDESPVFEFQGNPLRTGQTFTMVTSEYEVDASVTRVETEGETLPVSDSELVLETSLPSTTASEIEVGDQFTASGDVLAEVTGFETFAAGGESGQQYTLIGLTTRTIEQGGAQYFGDTRIAIGRSLTFSGDGYSFGGEIIDRGTSEIPAQDSEFVVETTLQSATADEIEVGDNFTAGGATFGEVTSLELFPETGGSDQRYALVGITARTVERDGQQSIGNTRIAVGQALNFDGDGYSFGGQIIDRGTSEIPTQDSEFVVETTLQSATADEIEAGDNFIASGTAFGEVTSLELFPGTDGSGQRYALVGITAKTVERDGQQYIGNTRIAVGQALNFDGDGYSFGGQVINRGTASLTTEARPLVVQTEVPATVANDIAVDDQFSINDRPIVTVGSVTVYPTANPDVRRVVLGVSAKTRIESGALLFGNRQLRIGSQLPIQTDNYDIRGEIIRRGSLNEPGNPTTQTVTVQLKNIPPERAESLTAGMTEESRDRTTAVVQNVSSQPAEIVLESEGGDIFLREHPRNKDVELTVDLSVRELEGGTVRFRGETLRVGQTIALELGAITVNGEIIEFEE